jgi:hypothetical protein
VLVNRRRCSTYCFTAVYYCFTELTELALLQLCCTYCFTAVYYCFTAVLTALVQCCFTAALLQHVLRY